MNAPDQNDIDEAKAAAAGRDVYLLEVPATEETFYMLATAPKKVDYVRFMSDIKDADPAKMMRAQETFVLSCRLWPSKEALKEVFEKQIFVCGKFGEELLKNCGLEAKATSKKL